MKLLFKIAFRNLIRQKKRNALLSLAIAFGMIVLIISNSFAVGLTDIFINKFMAFLTGHIEISIMEKANVKNDIIRDVPAWQKRIQENISDVKEVKSIVDTWGRVVANGKGENAGIIGISEQDLAILNLTKEQLNDFHQTPEACIIYKAKAKKLKVEVGDILYARFTRINGQQEGGRYTIVAILPGNNPFIGEGVYVSKELLRQQLGYKKQEAKKLQIILDKPVTANKKADAFHSQLSEELAILSLTIQRERRKVTSVAGIAVRDKMKAEAKPFFKGSFSTKLSKGNVYLSRKVARELRVKKGEAITIIFNGKYQKKRVTFSVAGVFSSKFFKDNWVLFSEKDMLRYYYTYFPKEEFAEQKLTQLKNLKNKDIVEKDIFLKRWKKLRRSKDLNDIMAKFAEFNKEKWKGQALDIRTMYETGTSIIGMEKAINAVTNIAIFFIFVIIIIGISNTVKMSLRERTREMGTNRAIGMQRKDLQKVFLLEIFLLLVFATAIGILVAHLFIWLISQIYLGNEGLAAFFLLEGHIHFVFNIPYLTTFIFIIWSSILVFVYFPIRKAAKIKPADALRFV